MTNGSRGTILLLTKPYVGSYHKWSLAKHVRLVNSFRLPIIQGYQHYLRRTVHPCMLSRYPCPSRITNDDGHVRHKYIANYLDLLEMMCLFSNWLIYMIKKNIGCTCSYLSNIIPLSKILYMACIYVYIYIIIYIHIYIYIYQPTIFIENHELWKMTCHIC